MIEFFSVKLLFNIKADFGWLFGVKIDIIIFDQLFSVNVDVQPITI